ncbi:MAG: DUF3417 domain-containing protein, partial [Pseudomonadota bacterium]|nr:DUF3417 domain-containing protein [Pseudomonadota bacterium]
NVSVLDGWWDEAYQPELGWPIGDDQGGATQEVDARDAVSLYDVLETSVIPEFYDRDAEGLPRAWLARIRCSMAALTPAFSSTRMLRQYVEDAYLPLAAALRVRIASGCEEAKQMRAWADQLECYWPSLHIGDSTVSNSDGVWRFSVPVFLGEAPAASVRVELFADAEDGEPAHVVALHREHEIPGSANGFIYAGEVKADRPAGDYTVRAVPDRQGAFLPSELPLIAWQR